MSFLAWVSFPDAPYTSQLIRSALRSNFSTISISTSDNIPFEYAEDSSALLLQWSTYDSLSHERTHDSPTSTLSSSYTIRKSLIRKHFLHRSLLAYTTKHPDAYLSRNHGAVPRTWDIDISWADELDELWSDELWELGELLDSANPAVPQWFILKPSMSDRGMGIRLFESKETLRDIFLSFEETESDGSDGEIGHGEDNAFGEKDTSVIASQLRHFVIQEYISDPLLLDPAKANISQSSRPRPGSRPTKFHIRAYCISSGALDLYVNPNFLALFAGAPYTALGRQHTHNGEEECAIDLSPHLTNTSLQTPSAANPDPNDNVRLLSEMIGCEILSRPGDGEILTKEDVDDITSQVCEILADTFRAALESTVHFQPLPNAFELFGTDLLVSHNPAPRPASSKFTVSILELNAEPAIEMTGGRLSWVLETMFSGICQACVGPFFGMGADNGAVVVAEWEVGETRFGLRKCLEVEVRARKSW